MWKCENVRMCKCEVNVRMWECEDIFQLAFYHFAFHISYKSFAHLHILTFAHFQRICTFPTHLHINIPQNENINPWRRQNGFILCRPVEFWSRNGRLRRWPEAFALYVQYAAIYHAWRDRSLSARIGNQRRYTKIYAWCLSPSYPPSAQRLYYKRHSQR